MHPQLFQQLEAYRSERNFNPQKWAECKINRFSEYLTKQNITKVVLPVSGGVDSAVCAMFLNLTKITHPTILVDFILINVPIDSSYRSSARSQELASLLGVKLYLINLNTIFNHLNSIIEREFSLTGTYYTKGQTKSYLRTTVAYTVAQLITHDNKKDHQFGQCVVMGTGNYDEFSYLGYFSKAGNGVCDFQLLIDLHKSEVYKLAKYLGVPKSIIDAKPTADLWHNQTDEDELGITYDFVELFTGYYLKKSQIKKIEFLNSLCPEAKEEFERDSKIIHTIHLKNKHKLEPTAKL